MRKIVLFTGAGFCVPLNLPTSESFSGIDVDSTVSGLLSGYLGDKKNDIEHILSVLESFVRDDSFTRYIINEKKRNGHFSFVSDDMNNLVAASNTSIRNIKTSIFKTLEKYDPKVALKLYTGLLNELRIPDEQNFLSIFTTNYDLTFETTFSQSNLEVYLEEKGIDVIDYGFSRSIGGSEIFRKRDSALWKQNVLEYTKLHGSLDWSANKGTVVRSGTTHVPLDPNEMLLLYPGWKGTPINDPFKTLHNSLYERLHDADLMIVIGFAFRDEYLNGIFENALRNNRKLSVLCYDPKNSKAMPKESKLNYFKETFPLKFHHIEKGISINESQPLEYKAYLKHISAMYQ